MDENKTETPTQLVVTELHKSPRRPFVELIVISSEGVPINTFSGENTELPTVLHKLAELAPENGFPIARCEALLALAQDIYRVDRDLVLMLLGTFYTKHWNDLKDIRGNLPLTAGYFLVVSR